MQVIDPHHHFWLVADCTLLRDGPNDTFLGNIDPIRRDYLAPDLLADGRTAGVEVVKSVAIQAFHDGKPEDETAMLQALAAAPGSGGFPHGIVAFANLAAPDLNDTLAAHSRFPNLRGIRQSLNRHPTNPKLNLAPRDYLADPVWRANLALLERFDLSLDLQLFPHQMAAAAVAVHENPGLQFILTHAGMPQRHDADSNKEWRRAIDRLAAEPNVAVKISGFSTFDREWDADRVRDFVLGCIDAFSVDRCMFASNYPVSKLARNWRDQWGAWDRITATLTTAERRKLFHDNAARLYRLD